MSQTDLEARKLELWWKHMQGLYMTYDEIVEYGKLTGFIK